MKCKNVDCDNNVVEGHVYCCWSCRNYYVNKYMRDYSGASLRRRILKEEQYSSNPTHCKGCGSVIPFDKRLTSKFCSSSCSATYNNGLRDHTWGDKIREGVNRYNRENGHNRKVKGYCIQCGGVLVKNKKFCNKSCQSNYNKNNFSENFSSYKVACQFNFNLADYPEEFDFSLIEEHGWYSPSNKRNNLGGISRDHIFSVRQGFEMLIDPAIISHPANCQLLIHADNISKHKKCGISLEDLLLRIEEFNLKYEIQ